MPLSQLSCSVDTQRATRLDCLPSTRLPVTTFSETLMSLLFPNPMSLLFCFHNIFDVPMNMEFSWHSDSNNNGSYYYSNDNGSTYYNSGTGYSQYTSPSGNTSSNYGGSKKWRRFHRLKHKGICWSREFDDALLINNSWLFSNRFATPTLLTSTTLGYFHRLLRSGPGPAFWNSSAKPRRCYSS